MNSERMTCEQTNEQLTSYLDGEIAPDERSAVEAHLKACDRCRAELTALRRTLELADAWQVGTAEELLPPDAAARISETLPAPEEEADVLTLLRRMHRELRELRAEVAALRAEVSRGAAPRMGQAAGRDAPVRMTAQSALSKREWERTAPSFHALRSERREAASEENDVWNCIRS